MCILEGHKHSDHNRWIVVWLDKLLKGWVDWEMNGRDKKSSWLTKRILTVSNRLWSEFSRVLQFVYVFSCSVVSNDLWPPWTSPPSSSAHGIFQARIPEWVTISSSRRSSQPRGGTHVSHISCTGRHILYHWATLETSPSPSKPTPFTTEVIVSLIRHLILLKCISRAFCFSTVPR